MNFLETLEKHLEQCPLAVVQWDHEFRVIYWSPRTEEIFGCSADAVLGKRPDQWQFVHEEDVENVSAVMQELMERRAPRNVSRNRNITADGKVIHCEWYNSLLFDDHGEMDSILSLVQDITDRKELEEKYQRSQRMENIGLLAGGIAHDLNNVLAPIGLGAELIQRQTEDPKIHRTLEIITRAVRRGSSLVRHILNFSRGAEEGNDLLDPEQMLKDAEEILSLGIDGDIRIIRKPAPDTWKVGANHTQVHQILVNLCVNARDAMPDGGELRLAAANVMFTTAEPMSAGPSLPPGRYVKFTVQDTGDGIPLEDQDRIFIPFFSSKPQGKGTGLGLPNSLELVHRYGGGLRFESERKKGTTFEVFLPAYDEADKSEAEAAPEEVYVEGNGEVILIADDEESIRSILEALLASCGFTPVSAADGVQALGLLHARRDEIKALITDIAMPNIDGINLVRALKSMGLGDLPILSFYGSATEKEHKVRQMEDLGVKHFIRKPFDAPTFYRALRDIFP